MNVILSIKPRYADAIMRGEKRYEFRCSLFKNPDVDRAFIYATALQSSRYVPDVRDAGQAPNGIRSINRTLDAFDR